MATTGVELLPALAETVRTADVLDHRPLVLETARSLGCDGEVGGQTGALRAATGAVVEVRFDEQGRVSELELPR